MRPPLARLLAGSATLLAIAFAPTPAHAAAADTAATVNADAGQATVPATALGVNDAVWDSQLGTTAVSDLLTQAGVGAMRYPGGSYADIYHWQDNTAPGGYVAPGTDFDTFMASAKRVNAQPMLIADYGSGTPEEAADWVRYANVTKGYGAKYWTIGNEIYGNGHYGTAWETDNHPDKSPAAYANAVVAYAKAMKAVDPSVKIGAVLTMPGNWPDGLVGAGDAGTWNQVVLKIAGPSIDFVDLHWYPGGTSAADSVAKTNQINDAMYLVRRQIATYAGNGDLGISLTETNVGVGEDTQPAALFLADAYANLLADGVFTVDWWDVHNGIGTPSTIAGQTDYNDFGMLSSGQCTADNSVCEPAVNTPFAPYYALNLLHDFVSPGDQLIGASTGDPLVTAHAARRANGDLAVLLVNKDPDNARTVDLKFTGFTPTGATPTVYRYTNGADAITTEQSGSTAAQTIPAYAIEVVVVKGPKTSGPGTPGTPQTTAVGDQSATISWPAATPGGSPIAKYEVYDQNGAELGETAGTTLTVANLKPGTRYTVNVLARDAAGNVSWASAPLTFTTGTPASSSCSVHFSDDNDWGNGFVADLTVTDDSQNPLDGWTLTFDWPTGWQSVSSGWNATWTQTGTEVRAVGTGTLAANGGSTGIGFVGAYSGPDVPPAVFRLNGTVCTTS